MVYRREGELVTLDGLKYVVERVTESSALVRVDAKKQVRYTDTATGRDVRFEARHNRTAHINPVRERGSR